MKIIEVTPLQEFRLFLRFEEGSAGVVDLASYAGRGVFAAWLQPGLFAAVSITEAGALEWPGEIDLCPDALYLQLTGKSPEDLFSNKQGVLAHA
jgi:hypothetical protein